MRKVVVGIALAALSLSADTPKEEPVGLILAAGGSKVLRAKTATPLAARSGDILFSGDSLKSEGATASFLYCPTKTSNTLEAGSDVLLDTKALKVRSGKTGVARQVALQEAGIDAGIEVKQASCELLHADERSAGVFAFGRVLQVVNGNVIVILDHYLMRTKRMSNLD